MICPLLTIYVSYRPAPNDEAIQCFERDCAWWNPTWQRCGLVALTLDLQAVTTVLSALAEHHQDTS